MLKLNNIQLAKLLNKYCYRAFGLDFAYAIHRREQYLELYNAKQRVIILPSINKIQFIRNNEVSFIDINYTTLEEILVNQILGRV